MVRRLLSCSIVALTLLSGRAFAQDAPKEPQPDDPPKDGWQDPAKAAEPPLLPPPSTMPRATTPPTSTSGTDVVPSTPATAPPIVTSDRATDAQQDARIRALESRVANDERRIKKLEERFTFFKNLKFESFIQPQFLTQSFNSAASPNRQPDGLLPEGIGANDTIARPDGSTTNGTFFRLRRTRLRTFYETDAMRLFLQLDVLPLGGPGPGIGTIVRNAETTGKVTWTKDIRTELTAGMFFTPFRAELLEASLYRPFIERTWFIQNCFPTERDIGVHAKTIALDENLVVDLSIVNGQRLGERYFVQLPDLNRTKDFIAYVTYKLGFITLGASGYLGRGQVVDGTALRFKQFGKWAVNYQALASYRLLRKIGETRFIGEYTLTRNMDTGVIYPFAIPRIPASISDSVVNLDGRALYLRLEQDLGRKFMLGYRYDLYSPDTNIKNNARDTHAFLAVVKFSKNLRWMNELAWAIDNVHAPGTLPTSKHIVSYSSVLQAMFY